MSDTVKDITLKHENAIEALKQGMLLSQTISEIHIRVLQSRIDRAIKAFSINPIRDSKDWAELERDVLEILEGKQ